MSPRPIKEPTTIGDLNDYQLFYLAFLHIYVSHYYGTVASHFNRHFDLRPPLRAKQCENIYEQLHDTQHRAWAKAKDMNRKETDRLRVMMEILGLPRVRWDVDLIQPVGSPTCYRPARRNHGKAGVDAST